MTEAQAAEIIVMLTIITYVAVLLGAMALGLLVRQLIDAWQRD